MEDGGNPWIAIIITIILVAINGMLASSEIAMMGLNETKLKNQAESGDKKSKLLLFMKKNPSDFLSTIQIGITLAGLLSGAFAADTLATPIVNQFAKAGVSGFALSAINIIAIVIITLIITYFMLVFGELVPKRLAMINPEKMSRRVASFINVLSKATKPLVKLLSASTNGVLKLMGVSSDQEGSVVTEEEIVMMAKEGQKQGKIEASEVQLMANLFEFTDLTAEEAMTHRVKVDLMSVDSSIEDVINLMSQTTHSKYPVFQGGRENIVGIVYVEDILSDFPNRRESGNSLTISEIMRKPYYVPESKHLVEIFNEMKRSRDTMAIVVDEYGGFSGIITIMDIIEEIVGDIEITYLDDIEETPEGYIMNGNMEMEDAAAFLELELNDDEENGSLSGFIIEKLGRVPDSDENASIEFQGYSFQARKIEGAVIKSVSVKEMPA